MMPLLEQSDRQTCFTQYSLAQPDAPLRYMRHNLTEDALSDLRQNTLGRFTQAVTQTLQVFAIFAESLQCFLYDFVL